MRHYVDPAGIPCGLDARDLSVEVTTIARGVNCPQCVHALVLRAIDRGDVGPQPPAKPWATPAKPWPITPETVRVVFGIDFPPERAGRIAELLMQLQEECSR